MNIEFDITESFNNDIKQLPIEEQKKIKRQINFISGSLLNGKTAFFENSSKPYLFNLKDGLESSLFLIKADENKRIVAAVDEDPIYDKISLTLFRLVDKKTADRIYKKVGEDLYRNSGIL